MRISKYTALNVGVEIKKTPAQIAEKVAWGERKRDKVASKKFLNFPMTVSMIERFLSNHFSSSSFLCAEAMFFYYPIHFPAMDIILIFVLQSAIL